MNIHEYQAKELLGFFGVNVTRGAAAYSAEEARQKAIELGGSEWVVKAQIHAGGRGKAGGVKFATSLNKVFEISSNLLGKKLVTHQTESGGKLVSKLYIQKPVDIKKEFYFAILLDRMTEMPVIMVSTEGGMDIEEVARNTPEKIIKVGIDPITGLQNYHLRELSFGLGLNRQQGTNFMKFVSSIFKAYKKTDAGLIEINPLVLLPDDDFIALDAKLNFDDNALYRHPDLAEMQDEKEEEPSELEAAKYNLSYVKLEGNVGCMVNGAGLAMSTMDIIKLEGGEPANFLDVGGGASSETIARGFEIILRDKNVKVILVNIFGGIVRCDMIAKGIIDTTKKIKIKLPTVVRLQGTNAEEAFQLLKQAEIKEIILADNLKDAAQKAVMSVKAVK